MTHQLAFAARSDRGLIRSSNQDSVYAGNTLLVVADGMGGHAAGDMASRLVVSAFLPLDHREPGGDLLRALARATRDGNAAIANVVHDNPELDGMGTTVTALLFDGGRLGLAHVGDSRAYLYQGGVLHQLTHDDTFVQSLIDDGRITQEEAAHHPQRSLLLRALNGTDVDPSLTIREVAVGDRYLICSDGLPGVVSAEAIADALASNPDPEASADALIQLALVGGGPDNITVIVADVVDTGVGTGPTEARAEADPDATGPIGSVDSIRVTQEMPRVPLPAIPEDTPAPPVYAADDEGADEGDAAATAPTSPIQVSGPPARRRHRGILISAIVLVGLGLIALIGFFWVRSQYFVGAADGQVVVYRGVDGSVLGIRLSSVQEGSCEPGLNGCAPLLVNDLQPAARDQVVAGIQAGTLDDARNVVSRLAGQMLPECPPPPTSPTTPSPATPRAQTTPPTAVTTGSGAAGGSPTAISPPPPGAATAVTPSSPPATGLAPGQGGLPGAEGSTALTTVGTLSSGPPTTFSATTGSPLPTRTPEPGVTCRPGK